jgi:glycerol kinase
VNRYKNIEFDPEIICDPKADLNALSLTDGFAFGKKDLADFKTDTEAYHHLISDIMKLQVLSTNLVMTGSDVKRIFVDGGFSRNSVYMHLLAIAFPEMEVFAASMPQASALGAALTIHSEWNRNQVPVDLLQIRNYP